MGVGRRRRAGDQMRPLGNGDGGVGELVVDRHVGSKGRYG